MAADTSFENGPATGQKRSETAGDIPDLAHTIGPRVAFVPDVFKLVDELFKIEDLRPVQALRNLLAAKNDYLLIGPVHEYERMGERKQLRLALFSDGFHTVTLSFEGDSAHEPPRPTAALNSFSIYAHDRYRKLDHRTWSLFGVLARTMGGYSDYTLREGVNFSDLEKLVVEGLSTNVVRRALREEITQLQKALKSDRESVRQ